MRRVLQIFFGVLLVALFIFQAMREPKPPALPKWKMQDKLLERVNEQEGARKRKAADVALVKGLLKEDLSDRVFGFGLVAEAVSGKRVIPAGERESSGRVLAAIEQVMAGLLKEMSGPDSPIHELRRINEGSKYFEDGLLEVLDAMDGIVCEIPKTRDGAAQRAGYPDLKITDEKSGDVYYLDPKLMEQGSVDSSFRTFYFEPKNRTLKITDDATHLLIGIEHDGNEGKWKFLGYRVVDLSGLKVRLKAEFQASNREMYSERSVLESKFVDGKDVDR
jgi:hypothetical protein